MRVIGVGDNTVDKYIHLGRMFPGGNAVNVAVLAKRYGHTASYIGWLADDVYGKLLTDSLTEEGIDLSHCRTVEGATNANCEVNLVNGDRQFSNSSSGVCPLIDLTDDDYAFIAEHHLTHTSIYSHIDSQLEPLKRASQTLSYDFSNHWGESILQERAPFVDIAILSYPDATTQDINHLARRVHALGPRLVLITRGSLGAVVFDGTQTYMQGVVETDVVDTLGAGDAFAARFMVEVLSDTPIQTALQRAALSAAETCTYYGAFDHGIPIP